MKRLVVTGDDFGLEEPIDAALLALHDAGCLDRVSLVTNTARFDACVAALAARPGLAAGVHLNLTDGRPLRGGRGLTGRDGAFPGGRHRAVAARLFVSRRAVQAARAEWAAQVARAREAGIAVAFLNAHGHLHLLPSLHGVVADLAREFAIPEVRLVRGARGWRGLLLGRWSRRLERRAGGGLRGPDRVLGLEASGRLDGAALAAILDRDWEGTAELVVHPAREDSAYHRRWGYRGAVERDALLAGLPDRRRA